jgi:hypothetical protein
MWRVDLKSGLYYVCFGTTQHHAMRNLFVHLEIYDEEIDWVSSVSNDDAQNILIQPDLSDESYVTLYEEALFWQNTEDYTQFTVSNFEIIADLTL